MRDNQADTQPYFFVCADVSRDTFQVVDFSGDERISQPYRFEITLSSSQSDISVQNLTGSNATLYIRRDECLIPFSGIIFEFAFHSLSTDYTLYKAVLVPRLQLLGMGQQSRVFLDRSVVDVVEDVFREMEMEGYYTIDCDPRPTREYIVQYEESNLNFISRLLEDEGIWYLFQEDPVRAEYPEETGNEHILITDKPNRFPEIHSPTQIRFRARSGLVEKFEDEHQEHIFHLSLSSRATPGTVSLRNYNYRTPEVDLAESRPVPGGTVGDDYRFGGAYKNVDEIQTGLEIAASRVSTDAVRLAGQSDCTGFRAGRKYELADPPRSDMQGMFLLTEIQYKGYISDSSMPSEERPGYENQFICISTQRMGRYQPPRRARRPRIEGIITARIESGGSTYASLDERGRYKIRVPFDRTGTPNEQGSKFIRLAQPYSGADYGIHFPSHEGTEMILGHIGGDPNRPIGLGTVPNANTASPVRSHNKEKSIIRTAGGNEIMLDDTDNEQKIILKTNGAHVVSLDDQTDAVTIKTTADNHIVLDDQNKLIRIKAGAHTITLSYDDSAAHIAVGTAEGREFILDDQNQTIRVSSPQGKSVELNDEEDVIRIADDEQENSITIDQNAGISIESEMDISIRCAGDLNIEAANIQMTADESLAAEAQDELSLTGTNVAANAHGDATVEAGANVTVTGGATATFEGSGQTEIKGGMRTAVTGQLVTIN